MTYQPRFQQCPYRTSCGKCVYRYRKQKITRRKRRCGHKHPENCEMYCEWLEMSNSTDLEEKSISIPITSPQTNIGESM